MLKTIESKTVDAQFALDRAISVLRNVSYTDSNDYKDKWAQDAIEIIKLAKEKMKEV